MSTVTAMHVAKMRSEHLPFTVRLVQNEADLMKAVGMRQAAYARHLPAFATSLNAPESTDFAKGVVILLAESKVDGSALGTMRIQLNRFEPLGLEHSLALPIAMTLEPLAEATRLGITQQRIGRVVKTILFKAFYQFCLTSGVQWMVVAGRFPIDRMYERLLFQDVYPGVNFIPLAHAGNIPHRVMKFNVQEAQKNWAAARHPMYDFIMRTHHPDIDVGTGPAQSLRLAA